VLQKLKSCKGIPKFIGWGHLGSRKINFMITEYLGPSIEDLFELCDREFSIKTICMIFHQLIQRIQEIHNKTFVHRDIKPDNFLFGYT
jgi:casein kinase 1